MLPSLRQKITEMASLANPSPEQLVTLLSGWEEYFRRMRLEGRCQDLEFSGIMRARVGAGQISLVAPDLNNPDVGSNMS